MSQFNILTKRTEGYKPKPKVSSHLNSKNPTFPMSTGRYWIWEESEGCCWRKLHTDTAMVSVHRRPGDPTHFLMSASYKHLSKRVETLRGSGVMSKACTRRNCRHSVGSLDLHANLNPNTNLYSTGKPSYKYKVLRTLHRREILNM